MLIEFKVYRGLVEDAVPAQSIAAICSSGI